jgi:hypothetical protein
MKMLALWILIAFISFDCSAQENKKSDILKKNDWTKLNLKGKVMTMEEKSVFKTKIKNGDSGSFTTGTSIFNELGYRTEFRSVSNNNVERTTKYNYDKEGNMIESNNEGFLKMTYTFKYDKKGNIIENSGRAIIESKLIENKIIYKYDDRGNMIEENTYYNFSEVPYSIKYIYDNNGNITEMSSKVISMKDHTPLNVISKFNDDGKIREENYYDSKGKFKGKVTYEYDSNGNVIMLNNNLDNGDPNKTTYKYEYDGQGNWIQEEIITNKVPTQVLYRTYKYYE